MKTLKQDAKVVYTDGRIRTQVYNDMEICPQGLQPFLYTDGGTLLAQYQLPEPPAGTRKYNFAYRVENYLSRDGGETWEKRKIAPDDYDDPFAEAGAVKLKDGSFLLLDTYVQENDNRDPAQCYGEAWISRDHMETFTGPTWPVFSIPDVDFNISSDDDGHESHAARLHRSMVSLPDGTLIATMYGHFHGDCAPASYEPRMMKTRTYVMRSTDSGATWHYLATVAVDAGIGTEGFGEPVLVRVDKGPHEGRLLCVMRTGRELYQAHSDDDGKTWSYFRPVVFAGLSVYDLNAWRQKYDGKYQDVDPHRKSLSGAIVDPDLIQMENGALVLSFGVRLPEKLCWLDPTVENNGVYAAFSLDGGDTWCHILRVMGGQLTTHYTAVREFAPNKLYFAYDVGSWRQGGRGGRGCRIDVELDTGAQQH